MKRNCNSETQAPTQAMKVLLRSEPVDKLSHLKSSSQNRSKEHRSNSFIDCIAYRYLYLEITSQGKHPLSRGKTIFLSLSVTLSLFKGTCPTIHSINRCTHSSSSSCSKRYVYDYYSAQYKPTVGVEYHSKSLSIDGTDFKLSFWDIVGVDKAGSVAKVRYTLVICLSKLK